jgi:hypothetical protein
LHTTPLPVHPGAQAQVKLPFVLMHMSDASVQVCTLRLHSSMSWHPTPLPV